MLRLASNDNGTSFMHVTLKKVDGTDPNFIVCTKEHALSDMYLLGKQEDSNSIECGGTNC